MLRTSQRKRHLLRALLDAPTQALVFFAISRLPLSNAYPAHFDGRKRGWAAIWPGRLALTSQDDPGRMASLSDKQLLCTQSSPLAANNIKLKKGRP